MQIVNGFNHKAEVVKKITTFLTALTLELCTCDNERTVFVFIVNKLGPFEKPFNRLGLRVSSGFPNTGKQ